MMQMNGGNPISYLIRDLYTTNLAAGSVNGTLAEPGPGTRGVVDSAGTQLALASGICGVTRTAANDPRLWYTPVINRVSGLVTICKRSDNNGRSGWGFATDTGLVTKSDVLFPTTNVYAIQCSGGVQATAVAAKSAATYYEEAIVLRATGSLFMTKGGAFTDWTLLWVDKGSNLTPLYLHHTVGLNTYSVDEIYTIANRYWLPTPLASDGMSAAVTDGLGHLETTGLGAGGSGRAYTNVGTWGVAAGVRSCSALDTGIGISTVDCGKADVLHFVKLTRSAGNVGVVVRYASATNYVYAYHDGTNVTLRKVVNGTDSQVLAPTAAAYAAGADMCIICYGTKFRVFYNLAAVGSEQTISDATLQSGTGVGLYTTNTGNTFDNLITYARGTGGEYANFI